MAIRAANPVRHPSPRLCAIAQGHIDRRPCHTPPEPLAPAEKPVLERVTAAAFGQRRKMLRTSLKALGVPVDDLLTRAGVAPTARAEELSIAEFCALARALRVVRREPRSDRDIHLSKDPSLEDPMRGAKWGNSLTIRLPATVVEAL